jgi:hypothetical protein
MRALPSLLTLLAINLVLALLLYRQQAAWTPVVPLDPTLPRLVLLSELPGAPSAPAVVPVEPTPGEPVVSGIPEVVPAPGTVVTAVPDATPPVPVATTPALTPPVPALPAVAGPGTVAPVVSAPPAEASPPVAVVAPPPDPPAPPPLRCLRLVGFGDQLAAQRALRRLQPQVEKAELHERTVRNVRSYWVYLPPAASRPAALEVSRQLGEKGLSDFFVTTTGANPNAISLGVFSTQANAERRQKQVIAAGFAAQIAERAEETRIHDLDLHWRSTEPLDWAKALPDFRGLRAEPLNCPTAG